MILKIPDVRTRLNWSPDRDGELLALIQGAEARFVRECDRYIEAVTNKEDIIVLRETQRHVRLKAYPLTEAKVIEWPFGTDRPDLTAVDADLLVADEDYQLNLETGAIDFWGWDGCLTKPRRFIVRMTGGLIQGTSPAIPADLKEALTNQVLQQASLNRADAIGLQSRRQGGKGGDLITFERSNGDLHTTFEEAIEAYRRR